MAEADKTPSDRLSFHCFDVVLSALSRCTPPVNAKIDPKSRCGGVFVTWDKIGRYGTYDLRGCIGYLADIGVLEGIETYAEQSAFRDTRFEPITSEEVSQLRCTVSLLHKFEDAAHVFDWDLKIHGIIINFSASGRKYTATYLPHVAAEQGWTKEQAIESLVRKSGYRRALTDAFRKQISVTRYQSAICKTTYAEYCRYRNPQKEEPTNSSRDAKRIKPSFPEDRRRDQYVR